MNKKDTPIYEQLALDMQPMDTDTYVFKSHNLIESGYNFTLNEQRLTYLASKKLKPRYIKSNIKPSQMNTFLAHETFKELKIYVNEFKEAFHLKSHNLYKVMEDTANSLYEKSIQYMQDDGTFVEKRWVITCKYNKEEKYVALTFHPDLILDLLVFKGKFGKMNYNSIVNFKSSYTFRIYELLQNYAYRGGRRFELEDLRYKLGIYDDLLHKEYKNFKRYILKPSIETINQSTELNVELKEFRYGRKVGAIEFIISQKATPLIELDKDEDLIDKSQVEEMEKKVGFKLTAGQVDELTNLTISSIKKNHLDMAFYEYIEYEVERVKEYAQTTTIKNLYGCLKTAIAEYWTENQALPKSNTFNNFEPRNYYNDTEAMKELEYKLLGWDKDND